MILAKCFNIAGAIAIISWIVDARDVRKLISMFFSFVFHSVTVENGQTFSTLLIHERLVGSVAILCIHV